MALAHHAPSLTIKGEPAYRRYLFVISFTVLVLLFIAAPWPFAHKAHVVLHGLCAQRPSHTLFLGGQPLPFDARMTGIYGGFLAAGLYFVARGRYRASRIPSIPTIILLGLSVSALAIDGTNSLLLDMLLWHPYEPDNRLRLLTGLLTGIALAAVVTFLLASTLWRSPRNDVRVVSGPGDFAWLLLIQAPFAAACLTERGEFFVPLTMSLVLAAVLALTSLMMATLALFRRQDGTFSTVHDLHNVAFWALLVAVAIMAFFSGGRFLLEHYLGPPVLT
ncbi:MAG: DUF2085 domain-containing protein [Thermomicrobiales bacterium]